MRDIFRFGKLLFSAVAIFWLCESLMLTASAGTLQQRLDTFPDWRSPPLLQVAQGDLYYPDWISGQWKVTSTLVDLAAPLAPTIITPGFEDSRKLLQKPIAFPVRFLPASAQIQTLPSSPFPIGAAISNSPQRIVADRTYNGMSLATALLGKDAIRTIETDPQSPNRQVTFFSNGQRLITQISDRGVEMPSSSTFVSSELYQQFLSSQTQIYFNRVENTISYHLKSIDPPRIEADQVTAIYLSPQDPDYFKAKTQPVTLYRYRLQFETLR